MKYCPSCLNQYTDLTLRFCLQDGTPLSAMPERRQSTIDTVAFSQPVTAASFLPTTDFRVEQPPQNRTQQNIRPETVKQAKRSNRALVALAIIIPVMTLSVAGVASGWYLLKDRLAVMAERQEQPAEDERIPSASTTQATPAAPESIKASDSPASTDAETVKAEIADLVERWKDLTEGHNAEKLSQMYGEKVDYLGKAGTTNGEIRASLQKTFDEFSDIDVIITNMSIAVDAEATGATALFDSEWDYEASPKLSSGKAHIKLHFQHSGTEWKIVSERQLKLYYKEN